MFFGKGKKGAQRQVQEETASLPQAPTWTKKSALIAVFDGEEKKIPIETADELLGNILTDSEFIEIFGVGKPRRRLTQSVS